eukprot:2378961-Rhodomonas_salina.2
MVSGFSWSLGGEREEASLRARRSRRGDRIVPQGLPGDAEAGGGAPRGGRVQTKQGHGVE